MTQLKTLKDLETNLDRKCAFEGIELVHIHNFLRQLKAEAVKWAKYYKEKSTLIHPNNEIAFGVLVIFLNFFNISESDLK